MRRALATALALMLLAAAAARAAFEPLGAGARAPGMGGAYSALADDAYAAFYNPAGLAQLERPELGMSYAQLFTGLSDGSSLGSSQLVFARPFARGKDGTLAASWDRFALSGLYAEQAFGLSYGRRALSLGSGGELMAGAGAKYLQRSFTPQPEATSACSGLVCGLGPDPALTGRRSVGAFDADLGLLYRLPRRFQVGVAVDHALAPDVGFAQADRLGRAYRAGVAYRSLWLSLSGEARLAPAPDGSVDRDYAIGGERVFPTLDYGQFAVRGGLGFGSREWRQVSVGGTYRAAKLQFDYAYLLPVGAVRGQSGTHRFGITLRFGPPTTEEELGRELLERARRLDERLQAEPAAAEAAIASAAAAGAAPRSPSGELGLDAPALAAVRELVAARRFGAARSALAAAAGGRAPRGPLARFARRLALAGSYYPDLSGPRSKADSVLGAGIARLLRGQDAEAMEFLSYALDLGGRDPMRERFVEDAEKETGLSAERLPEGARRGFLAELLYRAEAAFNRGDLEGADRPLQEAALLEPANPTALERLGSLRYVEGRAAEAADYWSRAQPLETRPEEQRSLAAYLGEVRRGAPAAPARAAAPAATEAPAAAAPARPAPEADPRLISDLYQKAVESYARGEQLQATALFLRILELDPRNEPARKALERLARPRPPGGRP